MIRTKQRNLLQMVSESLNSDINYDYYSLDLPLKSIIDTPLTDSLVNEIFHQQNNVNDTFVVRLNLLVFRRMGRFQQQKSLVNYSMLILK